MTVKEEIEDIFQTKRGAGPAAPPVAAAAVKKSRKRKAKKAKGSEAIPTVTEPAVPIVDATAKKPVAPAQTVATQKRARDEADGFGDSRGGKSKRKTTEDGFRIYDEAELKLGTEGGDTADCPFDCKCCF